MQVIRLSVRTLVEFLLRSGSIDTRQGGLDRAAEGARIHRKLQKEASEIYGENYKAEVFLSQTTEYEGITYVIEGRADGILFSENKNITIEEIKTVTVPLEQISNSNSNSNNENYSLLHWAQAKCYGYIYCAQNNLEKIILELIYFQVDSEEIKRFSKNFGRAELEEFYLDLLKQYQAWALMQNDWIKIRNASAKALPFPFPEYRDGQRKLAVAVYRTIDSCGRLFCQAPTGIGKTVSTLFPAIKAMSEGLSERIFYLTAKTITRKAAEEALALMDTFGLKLKRVTLTAKDKICFLEERLCNPDKCPYANGYYDRINNALMSFLKAETAFTRENLEAFARENMLCPFELALDCTLWCDTIICDYNYLFDPVVYLKRFFENSGTSKKKDSNIPGYIFLVDEAHNLVDRARGMYSAELCKKDFLALKKQLGKEHRGLNRAINKVNREMLSLRARCEEEKYFVQAAPLEDFIINLTQFSAACAKYLEEERHTEPSPEMLKLYFESRFFLKIADIYDEKYVTFVTKDSSQVIIKLLCLDPSQVLDAAMKKGRATILFSATLTPMKYFASVLGGVNKAETNSEIQACKQYVLPSPFRQENLCLLIDDTISTFYKDRELSLAPLAERIHILSKGKIGNYLVYFPSYKYMNDVYELFCELYPEIKTILQTSGMSEEAREEFLEKFDASANETLVGFCVLGGIYSEGIDLKGDRLIGTAIVGVGLPSIGAEQDILKDYYSKKNGMGFEYAYRFPGMNKVLQAAGRVIRGANDRGIVLLLDSRFSTPAYKNLFPAHWSHAKIIKNNLELEKEIELFYSKFA